MSEDNLLKKIAKMFVTNNERLLSAVDEKIRGSEQRLSKKIEETQSDTIESLSDVINAGYNHHEKRIKRLEDELDLPPLKLKH